MYDPSVYLVTKVDLRGKLQSWVMSAQTISECLDNVDWEPGVDLGVRVEYQNPDHSLAVVYQTGIAFEAYTH